MSELDLGNFNIIPSQFADAVLENGTEEDSGNDEHVLEPGVLENADELADSIIRKSAPESTNKATVWGVKKFNAWAADKGHLVDFATMTPEALSNLLRKFYAQVTGKKSQLTPSALTGIRAAIHRFITGPPYNRDINIISGSQFTNANNVFRARCKLYYKEGNPKPKHKKAIEMGDMSKLSKYFMDFKSSPTKLLYYVWFCIAYFFARRGREGYRDMTKETFIVKTDDVGAKYVCQNITETTKNHQGGQKQSEQDYSDTRMYSATGILDPVSAYEMYYSKLNPKCEALWQTPLKDTKFRLSTNWFKNEPLGKNTLGE